MAARRAAPCRAPRQRLHAVRSAATLGERLAALWQWLASWLPEGPAISGGPPLWQVAGALRERRPALGKRPAGLCWLVRISHAAVS